MPRTGSIAAIFDLDGTLANSELAHERALRAAAETRGLTLTTEKFHTRFVGLGEAACFRLLGEEQGLAVTDTVLAGLIATKLDRFLDEVRAGAVSPWPGALELVRRTASAMPVALCSGSSADSVGAILHAIGLDRAFGVVVTSGDVRRPKPDPEAYLLTAARLGVDPAACVAVEDSPTGIASAKAAGLRVIGVEHSFPAAMLRGAHLTVRTLNEIQPGML